MASVSSFSLSTHQLDELHTLVHAPTQRGVLGVRVQVHHQPDPVDVPVWTAEVVYNPADGGDLLGPQHTLAYE